MGKFATHTIWTYIRQSLVNALSLPPKPGQSTSLSAKTPRVGPFLLVFVYTPGLSVECVVGTARALWYIADSAQYHL